MECEAMKTLAEGGAIFLIAIGFTAAILALAKLVKTQQGR